MVYNLIFVGPPGCGKGTQAAVLTSELDFEAFSAGDELRKEVASGSELGRKIDEICSAGGLVSDDIVNKMTRNFLERSHNANKFLFDGFPRKISQAEELERLISEIETDKESRTLACLFEIDDAELLDRILNRFSCASCGEIYNKKTKMPKVEGVCDICGGKDFKARSDDNASSVHTRLENYHTITQPIIDFYEKRGILRKVDATQPFAEVSKSVRIVIDELVRS